MRFLFALLVLVSASAQADRGVGWLNISNWGWMANHSVRFFGRAWVPGVDGQPGSYRSNIQYDGTVVGEERYLIALSRMAYALAWTAHWNDDDARMARAREVVRFIQERMVNPDHSFRSVVDGNGNDLTPAGYVSPVNEQAYGLCGAVAVYRFTRDRNLLEWIRTQYRHLVARYHDPINKGFFDTPGGGTKSFASTIYIATSFLFDLYEADEEDRETYAVLLRELAHHTHDAFRDEDRRIAWIPEQFDAVWNFTPRQPFASERGTVSIVGHNAQFAWFLMRIADLNIVSPARAQDYRRRAQEILGSLLQSGGVDRVRGGFYNGIIRETNERMWGDDKHWWQQAEGLMAYRLAQLRGLMRGDDLEDFLTRTQEFYIRHFIDRNGGERQVVRADGAAILTGDDSRKGHQGKSAYHTVELSRFMRWMAAEMLRIGCSAVMTH